MSLVLMSLVLVVGCSSSSAPKAGAESAPAAGSASVPPPPGPSKDELEANDPVVVALEREYAAWVERTTAARGAASAAREDEAWSPVLAMLGEVVAAGADLAKRTEAARRRGDRAFAYSRFLAIEIALEELMPKLTADLEMAQSAADRARARATLDELRKEQAEIKAAKARKR